jgi:hypothetical protein
MDCVKILNSTGLVLGMIGVVLIFIWGPPQPQLNGGVGLSLEDGTPLENGLTVAENNQIVKRRRYQHKIISGLGLLLVFLGFLAQFIAVQLS